MLFRAFWFMGAIPGKAEKEYFSESHKKVVVCEWIHEIIRPKGNKPFTQYEYS